MSQAFDEESDAIAISRVDSATFQKLSNLVLEDDPSVMDSWKEDLFTSCSHLALQIAALGSQQSLRERNSDQSKGPTAFVRLQLLTLEWLQTSSDDTRKTLYNEVTMTAEECLSSLRSVYDHMDEHGVSIDLVYHLERTKALITRFLSVFKLFEHNTIQLDAVQNLMALLIYDSVHGNSIRALIDDNTALIAKKIAENSAETGEHYITRSAGDYWRLLGAAAGGGTLLAFTTWIKLAIGAIGLSAFWGGWWSGINYAVSFVIIMLMGWTVATKQPAMTAPAMAARLKDMKAPDAVENFVDEVVYLLRSQAVAILGNVGLVMPVVFALAMALAWLGWGQAMDPYHAQYILAQHDALGPTVLYAAATGGLLFLSSLIAGWAENWFVFHRLDSVIAYHPRVTERLGAERARRWGLYWRNHVSSWTANISLGLMLGLVPPIVSFFGIPMEVRHVTLVAGQIAAAIHELGAGVLRQPALWWAVGGIAVTGLTNLAASFTLAFRLALTAQNVPAVARRRVSAARGGRLRRQPHSFLLPGGVRPPAPPAPAAEPPADAG